MKKGMIVLFIVLLISSLSASTDNYVGVNPVVEPIISDNSTVNNKISLNLKWDEDEIINGKAFEIKLTADNLQDKNYDVKVFIYEDDKDKTISQTENQEGKWASSTTYVKNFFNGPGDKNDRINLRIRSEYKDFEGDANVGIRIRENGKSSYKEFTKKIEILTKNSDSNSDDEESKESDQEEKKLDIIYNKGDNSSSESKKPDGIKTRQTLVSEEIIKLGNPNLEVEKPAKILYKSKNEIIKQYSIYFFAFLCVVFIILLLLRRVYSISEQRY